jgi:hypothetical protein
MARYGYLEVIVSAFSGPTGIRKSNVELAASAPEPLPI